MKRKLLSQLAESKKFFAFAVGVISVLLCFAGQKLSLSEQEATWLSNRLLAVVGVYLPSQAAADFMKEKAKIEKGQH